MNNPQRVIAEQRAALGEKPTVLQIAKSLRALDALDAEAAGLKQVRLGVVSSFTFDPLLNALRARAYCDGLRLAVHIAPFGQYVQQLIDPDGELHRFRSEVVLAAVRLQDACPELYDAFNGLDAAGVAAVTSRWQTQWSQALEAFRRRSNARLFWANYEEPPYPSLGLADTRAETSQRETIRQMNEWLEELAGRMGDCQVLDADGLAARCGRDAWTDPKLWIHARLPIAAAFHWTYAGEVVRLLRAAGGMSRKVLALDCDDALWGGILGEVGREGIALGHDYPGSAFVAFQRRALELWRRGVVLVVASKNEPAAVTDVFENHPDMVLRPEHIAYFAVNWEPKPDNLRRAAESLNLGLDSFVFVDNDAVECAMMRDLLPEVLTLQLPEDPAEYERMLSRLDVFDQLTVSEEDRARGAMYRQEAARADLKSSAGDLESFYHQLEMRAIIARNDPATAARAAQLTQRTNQFNMTTIRRSESQIRDLMIDGRHEVFTLRLQDRFGDNGIVGLAIVKRGPEAWELDTFLMSCRVLGRTVEQTFLAWIGRQARDAGPATLVGRYRPTGKNKPFGEFYRSWGMSVAGSDPDGAQRWTYDVSGQGPPLQLPPWVAIHERLET